MKLSSLCGLLICGLISVNLHAETVSNLYQQIITLQDVDRAFDHVTYSLTEGNLLDDQFLIQFPGSAAWGMDAQLFPGFGFDAKADADFGLPHCETDQTCLPGRCLHLSAFSNGITGQTSKMCVGMADQNLSRIYDHIIQAKQFVDITTLEPFPNLRFKATLRNALTYLATTGRPITVRILDGLYEPIPTTKKSKQQLQQLAIATTRGYLLDLIRDLKSIPNANLHIYVAGMRTCSAGPSSECAKEAPTQYMALSWNHSKIINVDGEAILSGGVNHFSEIYLEKNPVFDMMMQVKGPTAAESLGFTNMLWDYVKDHTGDMMHVIAYGYENGVIVKNAMPPSLVALSTDKVGPAAILSAGRTGGGILPKGKQQNASDLAQYLLLNSATESIYVGAQSLNGPFNTWPFDVIKNQPHTSLLSALASLLIKQGEVKIVTSAYSSGPDMGSGYNSHATQQQIWQKIKSEVQAILKMNTQNATLSDDQVNALLCGKLHIAQIQFSASPTWQDGMAINDHYKFLMVDNHLFYIGSQNFYPAGLQEYGYIIEDPKAAATIKSDFWDKLWQYSSLNEYKDPAC